MPTLKRFGSVSVRMYADDHRPPVQISDMSVIAGEAPPGGIAEALGWTREHREMLTLKWAELNERG